MYKTDNGLIRILDIYCVHSAGKTMQKRYFFYNSKDNYQSDNNRSNYKRAAAAGCGFWRSIGKEKQIVATTCSDQCACSQAQLAAVLAVRKTLVFFGSHGRKKKTKHHHCYRYQHQNGSLSTSPRWFMHEYHLRGSEVLGNNWVLCSVFQKRRKPTSKKRGRTSALDNIGSCGHLPKPSNMFDWNHYRQSISRSFPVTVS